MGKLSDNFTNSKLPAGGTSFNGVNEEFNELAYPWESTHEANAVSATFRFRITNPYSSSTQRLMSIRDNTGSDMRLGVQYFPRDSATTARAGCISITCQNTVATAICRGMSFANIWDDGDWHYAFFAYDATAGTMVFKIDGQDANDTSNTDYVAPTTGTLPTSSNMGLYVGYYSNDYFHGSLSHIGAKFKYLTNWDDFMEADGTPKELDTNTWREWNGGTLPSATPADCIPHWTSDGTNRQTTAATTWENDHLITASVWFKCSSVAGTTVGRLLHCYDGSISLRLMIAIGQASNANYPEKIRVIVQNTSGTSVMNHTSATDITDGNWHHCFVYFDGENGRGGVLIDGVDDTDYGHTSNVNPTAGVLQTAIITTVGGQNTSSSTANGGFDGEVAAVMVTDQYIPHWRRFYNQASHIPIMIGDHDGWDATNGQQPLYWAPYGLLTLNHGHGAAAALSGSASSLVRKGAPLIWAEDGYMEFGGNKGLTGGQYTRGGTPQRPGARPAVLHRIRTAVTNAYTPAMMNFDGSTGYYSDASITTSGNKVTGIARVRRSSFTGGGTERILHYRGSAGRFRILMAVWANDHATPDLQGRVGFIVQNSAGTNVAVLISNTNVCDNEVHTVFCAYDGDAGTAILYVDGADDDNTGATSRIAPTTATLDTGAGNGAVGSESSSAATNVFGGDIGFAGVRDVYLTNVSDFFEADGRPKELDESGWTEWGAQPLFWNEHGDMSNNLGSSGDFTKNGTIIVGKGGN